MFTAEQYRAKAAEFKALLIDRPRSPNEMIEFRDLERTYTTLAENEEWMAVHIDKRIQRTKNRDNHTTLSEEEEQILKCLGAAVIMRWNNIPTKLQRDLFDSDFADTGQSEGWSLRKGQWSTTRNKLSGNKWDSTSYRRQHRG
jgi:hypothetical protein